MLQTVFKSIIIITSVITILFTANSCSNKKQVHQHTEKEVTTYYTCSMHPQVQQPNPGNCPICGMKLIKAEKTAKPKPDELLLSDQQIRLGNITVDTIGNSILGDETVLPATINFNQRLSNIISSRVMGRIERLHFKNVGDYVAKGQNLFDIYSEELNNAKQEYILAIQQQKELGNSIIDFQQLIQSARNKLQLWGMSNAQINQLSKSKNAPTTTSFYSNASGYITSLDVKEGEYVMEGGSVVQLADLSTLWVEAQVYTSELSKIDPNETAMVKIPDMPGTQFNGKIEFVNPEINTETRINLIRIAIPNANHHLKPGMPAYVYIKGTQRNAISLPIDAVIRDGNGATVWIKTGKNTFKSKMVQVGLEVENRIEITGGLNAGDVVVTTGAYLINSEYIFKNGAKPMDGMKM
ncbi:MAG: efflux RND transporter periplasmic adaptor subunit [Ferruginibacter sp.]